MSLKQPAEPSHVDSATFVVDVLAKVWTNHNTVEDRRLRIWLDSHVGHPEHGQVRLCVRLDNPDGEPSNERGGNLNTTYLNLDAVTTMVARLADRGRALIAKLPCSHCGRKG